MFWKKLILIWAKVYQWLKVHVKLILTTFAFGVTFFLHWQAKKNKIKKLKSEIHFLKAKVELEKLAVKYKVMIEELARLKVQDSAVRDDLIKIEKSLMDKLSDDMTIEEIAEKFNQLLKNV